ncbi:MAG: type III-B CRISPR module RAMP protein Cmr1 [Bacillota bacterium]
MKLEVSYHVTTPLFLGGANAEEIAELRPPTIKGLVRFWFRAVALPRLGTWPAVWKAERGLFGSTESQGVFLLSLVSRSKFTVMPSPEPWHNHGAIYLGYGVVDRDKTVRTYKTVRPYLKPGGSFTVQLIFKKGVSKQDIGLLAQALKALGLFGGAGARARKGFGSLSLKSLHLDGREAWHPPTDKESLQRAIREFLGEIGIDHANRERPAYTAFSPETKVCIAQTGRDAFQLLDEIGKEFLRYRSYGRQSGDEHVLPWGETAEQNFRDDHDLVLNHLGRQQITNHPRRAVFGLPHNYFFLSTKQKATVEAASLKRRASPLFIHIHALANGQYAAVLTLLPAVFLPEGEPIKVSGGRSTNVPCNVDFRVIEAFLNRPRFKERVVVWP